MPWNSGEQAGRVADTFTCHMNTVRTGERKTLIRIGLPLAAPTLPFYAALRPMSVVWLDAYFRVGGATESSVVSSHAEQQLPDYIARIEGRERLNRGGGLMLSANGPPMPKCFSSTRTPLSAGSQYNRGPLLMKYCKRESYC